MSDLGPEVRSHAARHRIQSLMDYNFHPGSVLVFYRPPAARKVIVGIRWILAVFYQQPRRIAPYRHIRTGVLRFSLHYSTVIQPHSFKVH